MKKYLLSRAFGKLTNKIFHPVSFENYFNVPIKFFSESQYVVNERIVEWTYILSNIDNTEPKKILDFGCTRNWICLSLASMGHEVTGVDLRNYPFHHNNFKFHKINILNLNEGNYDYIISLSTIEHVGSGAYGENKDSEMLDKVLGKIYNLLKDTGHLILTLPIGLKSIDDFERSFAPEEFKEIMNSHYFTITDQQFFIRDSLIQWKRCSINQIKKVSNDVEERKKNFSGSNGVGCYILRKSDR